MSEIQSPQFAPQSNLFTIVDGISAILINPGGAIPTDSDPNSVAPPASRIIHVSPRRGVVQNVGAGFLRAIAIDGTTITIRGWIYEAALGVWVRWAPDLTITYGTGGTIIPSGLVINFAIGSLAGAPLFGQITANTGVTKLIMAFM